MFSSRTAIAMAVLGLSSLGAQAGNTFTISAGLSQLSYSLADLRPDDGQAAAFSFDRSGEGAFMGAVTIVGSSAGEVAALNTQPAPQGAGQTPFDAAATATWAEPGRSGSATAGQGSLFSQASLSQKFRSIYVEGAAASINLDPVADMPLSNQTTLVLGAFSKLTISGLATVSISGSASGECEHCGLDAEAQVGLFGNAVFGELFGDGDSNTGTLETSDFIEGQFHGMGYNQFFLDGQPLPGTKSQVLSLSLVNNTATAQTFGFVASAWVNARTTNAAPYTGQVPEAQTWGMALAGLLVSGGVAWRRRRA